jgi:hypothetical protein
MTDAQDHPASGIIDAFGGIRPMASKLGIPVSTVQGWKQRDSIPDSRMDAIRAAARDNGIALPDRDASAGERPTIEHEPDREPRREAGHAPAATTRSGGAMPVAVLALLIALGAGGWSWWTIQGQEAVGEDPRLDGLEAAVARLAREVTAAPDDPGAEGRARLEEQLAALRERVSGLSGPGPDGDAVAALRDALAATDARVSELGAVPGVDAETAARIAQLEAEVENAVQLAATNMQAMSGGILEFEGRLAALTERVDGIAARLEEISALVGRVGALETASDRNSGILADAVALSLAASQLRRAVETGAPYPGALATLKTFTVDDPDLATHLAALAAAAQSGVTTRAALTAGFADTIAAVLSAVPDEADTLERMLGRLQEVVRVRRIGGSVSGDTPEAVVARAEFLLDAGDVAGALEVLSGLDGAAARAAQGWSARARTHLDAAAALAGIEAYALARLTAAGSAR